MFGCKKYKRISKQSPFLTLTTTGMNIKWKTDKIELDVTRLGSMDASTYTPSDIVPKQNKVVFAFGTNFFEGDGGRYKAVFVLNSVCMDEVYFEYDKKPEKVTVEM